jgi:hypothetical protein
MKSRKIFLLLLFLSYCSTAINPEWTKKYKCGEGLNCTGLDPPADGCYYNYELKKGLCYHIVEGMGYVYFKGKLKEGKSGIRMLQNSPCSTKTCSSCLRTCYDPNCTTPTSCSWCTCFPGTWTNPDLTQPSCCPLPAPGSGLD